VGSGNAEVGILKWEVGMRKWEMGKEGRMGQGEKKKVRRWEF